MIDNALTYFPPQAYHDRRISRITKVKADDSGLAVFSGAESGFVLTNPAKVILETINELGAEDSYIDVFVQDKDDNDWVIPFVIPRRCPEFITLLPVTQAPIFNREIKQIYGLRGSQSNSIYEMHRFPNEVAGTEPIGWTVTPVGSVVVQSHDGVRSLHLQQTTAVAGTGATYLSDAWAGDRPTSEFYKFGFSGYIKLEQTDKAVAIAQAQTDGARLLWVAVFENDGHLYLNPATANFDAGTYNANEWIHLRIEINFNELPANHFSAWVNGQLVTGAGIQNNDNAASDRKLFLFYGPDATADVGAWLYRPHLWSSDVGYHLNPNDQFDIIALHGSVPKLISGFAAYIDKIRVIGNQIRYGMLPSESKEYLLKKIGLSFKKPQHTSEFEKNYIDYHTSRLRSVIKDFKGTADELKVIAALWSNSDPSLIEVRENKLIPGSWRLVVPTSWKSESELPRFYFENQFWRFPTNWFGPINELKPVGTVLERVTNRELWHSFGGTRLQYKYTRDFSDQLPGATPTDFTSIAGNVIISNEVDDAPGGGNNCVLCETTGSTGTFRIEWTEQPTQMFFTCMLRSNDVGDLDGELVDLPSRTVGDTYQVAAQFIVDTNVLKGAKGNPTATVNIGGITDDTWFSIFAFQDINSGDNKVTYGINDDEATIFVTATFDTEEDGDWFQRLELTAGITNGDKLYIDSISIYTDVELTSLTSIYRSIRP